MSVSLAVLSIETQRQKAEFLTWPDLSMKQKLSQSSMSSLSAHMDWKSDYCFINVSKSGNNIQKYGLGVGLMKRLSAIRWTRQVWEWLTSKWLPGKTCGDFLFWTFLFKTVSLPLSCITHCFNWNHECNFKSNPLLWLDDFLNHLSNVMDYKLLAIWV